VAFWNFALLEEIAEATVESRLSDYMASVAAPRQQEIKPMSSKKIVAPGVQPQTKPVGIWFRISTEDQARGRVPSTTNTAPASTRNSKAGASSSCTTSQV